MAVFLRLCLFRGLLVLASQYDPHLLQKSPWFEGWYTRISETPTGQSVGLIVGHYPEKAQLSDAAAYLALIIDEGKGKTTVVEANPPGLTVLKHGAAIANEPDDASEPDFEVSGGNGTLMMKQTGTQQRISMWFPSRGFRFEANLTDPVPWSSSGQSPEGWAGKLPFLALHWFVYSLSSHASYRLESPTGVVLGHGRAHQEKNWGESFPKSWTWGEGLQGLLLFGSELRGTSKGLKISSARGRCEQDRVRRRHRATGTPEGSRCLLVGAPHLEAEPWTARCVFFVSMCEKLPCL